MKPEDDKNYLFSKKTNMSTCDVNFFFCNKIKFIWTIFFNEF